MSLLSNDSLATILAPYKGKSVSLWWVKKDMRLQDNPALTKACESGLPVIALFCFEPSVIDAPESSAMHVQAQLQALHDLHPRLQMHGIPLLTCNDEVLPSLQSMQHILHIDTMYATQETGSMITFNRDKSIIAWCANNNVLFKEVLGQAVFRALPALQNKKPLWDGFMRLKPLPHITYRQHAYEQSLREATHVWNALFSMLLQRYPLSFQIPAGETAAHKVLSEFLTYRGEFYNASISSPNSAFDHGSRLSVFLAWGSISSRTVFYETQRRIDEAITDGDKRWSFALQRFQSRLHWRDHFIQRLESNTRLEFEPMNPVFKNLKQTNDPTMLYAWLNGQTGYPLIDASMRCLRETGFINFRMRAMVVSFACHILDVSWKSLLYPLAGLMLDYEPGIHISQVQMQAGLNGWNAVRIYNPTKQLIDQDPDCIFVKQWVPELRNVSAVQIVAHIDYPIDGYCAPIVPYEINRKRAADNLYALQKVGNNTGQTKTLLAAHGSKWGAHRRIKRIDRVVIKQRQLF